MRRIILTLLALQITVHADIAPEDWLMIDKPHEGVKKIQEGGHQLLLDYKGAWKNKEKTLGVFVTYMRPNHCKSQKDIVTHISAALRQKSSAGSVVLKVEGVKGNLGLRVYLKSNGKSSDELVILPSDKGWTSVGINYLGGSKSAKGFDIDKWDTPKLSEKNVKKYREVITWFVGYSDEFIRTVLAKSDKK